MKITTIPKEWVEDIRTALQKRFEQLNGDASEVNIQESFYACQELLHFLMNASHKPTSHELAELVITILNNGEIIIVGGGSE